MKKLFFLLFIFTQISIAKDGKEVIVNFVTAFKNYDVVQYNMHFVLNDSETGIIEKDYKCAESYVNTDTLMSGYYNIQGDDIWRIYFGSEYLEYEPDTYEKEYCEIDKQKEKSEKFGMQKYKFDGIEAFLETPVKNLMITDHLLLSLFSALKGNDSIMVVSDTVINNRNCCKIVISANTQYIFDKINHMPVYVYMANSQQKFEATYSDYKFNQSTINKLYSRKAFPKSFKILENPKEIVKESLKVGEPVPEWELSNIYGKNFNSKDLKGKPVFLIFSKISCVPCMLSVPYLNKIRDEFKDLEVIAIYPLEKKEALVKYSKEKEIKYEILCDAKEVASKYFVDGYPTFFFIGKNGKLVNSMSGYGEGVYDEWVNEIAKILK